MIKKILATSFTLILIFSSFNFSFASEQPIEYTEMPLIFESNNLERASSELPGDYGTAYIGAYGRTLNWRLTSKKGPIMSFIGTLRVKDLKGRTKATLTISGGGKSTISGQRSVPSNIKKGTYMVEMSGSGVTSRGTSFYIGRGLHQSFTIY